MDAYYIELGLDHGHAVVNPSRAPFDDKMCDLVLEFHLEVVSFHFGLPDEDLLLTFAEQAPRFSHLPPL